MISFKEFLKRKEVLNEELQDDFKVFFAKNDKAKVVNDWLKKNKNINFLKKNNKFKIEAIKEINKKLPEDKKIDEKDANEINEIVTKINDLYKRLENKKEGNVGEGKEGFITTLLDNSTKIKTIEQADIETILKCFKKSNVNGDTKIDKKEFIDAIKEIKTKLDIDKAAVILWLAYFRQCVIAASNNGSLITGEGALSKGFIEKLQEKNTNNSFDDGNIDDLKRIFVEFGKFQMDLSVLKNFKSIDAAKKILQKKDEELENIAGNFTQKTEVEKKEEKEDEECNKKNNELNDRWEKLNKDNDGETEADKSQDSEEVTKPDSDSQIGNDILQKRNWYIFNTKPPKPGEEIETFQNDIKKEVAQILGKIGDGLEKYVVNKTEDDLKQASVSEMIQNCIKKSGFIVENNDTLANEFEYYKKELDDYKKQAEKEIDSLITKLTKKALEINNAISATSDYKKTVKLQTSFKKLFIDYGYDISKIIKDATEFADGIIEKAKKNKNSDDVLSYKSSDQKAQEEKDVERFKGILSTDANRDSVNLARYLLVNLLANLDSSKNIFTELNKSSFDEEMFNKGYIYAGSSGKVYVPSKYEEERFNEVSCYKYPLVKTETFKNPASLLKAAGIDVHSLSVDVLKKLKGYVNDGSLKNVKEQAEIYIKSARELYSKIQASIGNSSTVTEGLFGIGTPKANNDMSNYVSNGTDSQEGMEKYFKKVDIAPNFDPKRNQPDDIALRQFLKGFVLVKKDGVNYVTSIDIFDKNKEEIKGMFSPANNQGNKLPRGQNVAKQQGDESTPDEKAKAQSIESNGKVGETYDPNAIKQPSSVVTSANADSTYGDGYGYSKKAKAIKKKLNSTTYTYSPNPKMKIVRRTFD